MDIRKIIKEEINDISWIQGVVPKWDTSNIHLVAGKKFYVADFPPPTYTIYQFQDEIRPKPNKKFRIPMPGIKVCWEEKRNKKNPNRCNSNARWRIIELLNNGTWILMDDEPITESTDLDWIKNTKPSLRNKVIVFEPMIDSGEWEKVVDLLMAHVLEYDEEIFWWGGRNLDEFNPMTDAPYDPQLLHHLIINGDGRMVFGAMDADMHEELLNDYTEDEIRDLHDNYYEDIDLFLDDNRFGDYVNWVDGRKYFNIPYTTSE
jgi:hypothetical protein